MGIQPFSGIGLYLLLLAGLWAAPEKVTVI
jgi:hypothetical protein